MKGRKVNQTKPQTLDPWLMVAVLKMREHALKKRIAELERRAK